jgi:hypothetical protein
MTPDKLSKKYLDVIRHICPDYESLVSLAISLLIPVEKLSEQNSPQNY